MNSKKQIKMLLKERGILIADGDFASHITNNRVNKIDLLTSVESEKLLTVLQEFTPEKLIDGIYLIAFDMGLIKSKVQQVINDQLVINFCNDMFPNKLLQRRLFDLSYTNLYIIADKLGKLLIAQLARLN